MELNDQLKKDLSMYYDTISVPGHLRNKVLNRVDSHGQKKKMGFAKRAILIALMLCLLTPAFAIGYTLIAHKIYGSFESASTYGITESEYLRFDNKLHQASQILQPKEFLEFIGLAKDLIFFMLEHGDRKNSGRVDVSKLSLDEQKEYHEIITKIQPYFDKLNNSTGIQ